MRMIQHFVLKLKETKATPYRAPRLNDTWIDRCVKPVISIFPWLLWYVGDMYFEKQFHQNPIPMLLSRTVSACQYKKREKLSVLVALGRQSLRYSCFCKVVLLQYCFLK